MYNENQRKKILNREDCIFHKGQIVLYKGREATVLDVRPMLIIRMKGTCEIICGNTLLKERYPLKFHCKAQLVGIGQFVRCLEDFSPRCPFAIPIGTAYFCHSPARLDITKKSFRTEQEDMNDKVLPLFN